MPYGYTGGYVQPWQSVGMGLRNIGKLMGDQQRRDEALRQAQMRERAEALARPGARTFEDAASQYEFENIGDLANADVNVAPRFATPPPMDVPLPGTGSRPQDGIGPVGPDRTVRYQPETPVIGPSGIVQTDPGPHGAIGKIMLERKMQEALAGPQGPQAPVPGTPEAEEWFRTQERIRAEFRNKPDDDSPESTSYSQALNALREDLGTSGLWEEEKDAFGKPEMQKVPGRGHVWTYKTPEGTDIPREVIEKMARDHARTGIKPDLPDEYLPMATPITARPPDSLSADTTSSLPMMAPTALPAGAAADTMPLPMAAPMDTTGLPGPLPAPSPAMRPDSAVTPSSSPFQVGSEPGPANYGAGGGPPAGMGGGAGVAGYGKPAISTAKARAFAIAKIAEGMDQEAADKWVLENYTVQGF